MSAAHRRHCPVLLLALLAAAHGGEVREDFALRARVIALTPERPARILWRWGGEGLGGSVVRGELTAVLPAAPTAPKPRLPGDSGAAEGAAEELLEGKPADRVVVEGKTFRYHYLRKGTWSPEAPVASLRTNRRLFLTFTLEGLEGFRKFRDVEVEIEFRYRGKRLKTLLERGPAGPTVGIVVPLHLLDGETTPESPEFLNGLCGLLEYATRRTRRLEALPWAARPVPTHYGILTDCGGYGEGAGYGIRHTNKAIMEIECRAMRQLGMTGLRGAPACLHQQVDRGEGIAGQFRRIREVHGMGYPVPAVRRSERTRRITSTPDGAGCPFHPDVATRTREGVARVLAHVLAARVDEVWALTVDEIGSAFDGAPEGKGHQSVCPRCIEGFRTFLKASGLTPGDFGAADWSALRPNVYLPRGEPGKPPPKPLEPWLQEPGWSLLTYWSRRFNCTASAQLFTPLREAFAKANAAKREALARGAAAPQPWVASFALRGNTFLMGGHSLDFFNFYRHADNAFVYETSNRDPRVWQWDSYLCDVGRVVSERMGTRFGIYVKPHRGAPVQRALAALARGATMLFWYTYGPDYKKGDSFSQRPDALDLVSKAARLIGATEHVLHGSELAVRPQVAVVRPRSSEIWGNDAAWENGKWVYAALQHAHIPVDPLDEGMLAEADLSRYKAIYISGTHLTRAAAGKVAAWVEAGGTLYTSGWGLTRDEANQPLAALAPVLGLDRRDEPEMWCRIRRYGATRLATFRDVKPPPQTASVTGKGIFEGSLAPVVGRETLVPAKGAEVLATFADGSPAATRHPYGKGAAIVVGLFAGLEYAVRVHRDDFDMSRDFDPVLRRFIAAPALGRVQAVVDAAQPTVEGILVRNRESGKMAVALMNWAYRGREIVPFDNLAVTLRGAGRPTKITAAWLDRPVSFRTAGDAVVVTLPRLDEAEILLLE